MVRVTAQAVDGRATQAAIEALASALDVPQSTIRIVAGASVRTKVIEVTGVDPDAVKRLLTL
jgi:hypothetical protein